MKIARLLAPKEFAYLFSSNLIVLYMKILRLYPVLSLLQKCIKLHLLLSIFLVKAIFY